jgi:hypothetical protein
MYIYTGTDGYTYSISCNNSYYNGFIPDYGVFYPFNYVVSRHSDTDIFSSQGLQVNPTGTRNCAVTNKFVQWSTGVYGITPAVGSMSGAYELGLSNSIYINKIEPYSMSVNNLATINLSYACCIDAILLIQ